MSPRLVGGGRLVTFHGFVVTARRFFTSVFLDELLQQPHVLPWLNPCEDAAILGASLEPAFYFTFQGLNVVIVSMDDQFLADTFALVTAKFPGQEFRKVGATFSPGVDYMDKIK